MNFKLSIYYKKKNYIFLLNHLTNPPISHLTPLMGPENATCKSMHQHEQSNNMIYNTSSVTGSNCFLHNNHYLGTFTKNFPLLLILVGS